MMSEEQLKAFLQAVKADSILQEKLKSAPDTQTVVTIAKEAGFNSSADEERSIPMQLETLLSESCGNISGGQGQRIAIACALITQPKVLIMDEATRALDNTSQQVITHTINELGITRISIAQRLTTIQHAD